MKRLLALTLVLILLVSCSACFSGNQLLDHWVVKGAEYAPSGFPSEMEFFSDGTCVLDSQLAKYGAENGRLKIIEPWGAHVFDYRQKNGELILADDYAEVVYVKKSNAIQAEPDAAPGITTPEALPNTDEAQTGSTADQFTYELDPLGNACITGYSGSEANLVIHSVLDGHPVTAIGTLAFAGNQTITRVTLPPSIISIHKQAFTLCTSLESIVLPDGLKEIGECAFEVCPSLASITIPGGVTSIGEYAFSECYSLSQVSILEGVQNIGPGAFCTCPSLTDIILPNSLTSIDALSFTGCEALRSISIPGSVTYINSAAFDDSFITALKANYTDEFILLGNQALAIYNGSGGDVVVPNGVRSVAFINSDTVTSVTLPNSMTRIGKNAFWCCDSLTHITLPNGVTHIEDSAFTCCTSLTSISLPTGLTHIGERAFDSCSSLTSIVLPEGVTDIGVAAFYDCTSLTDVTLPSSVTSIGALAFGSTPFLDRMKANCADEYLVLGNNAVAIYNGKGGEVHVPEGIRNVDFTYQDTVTSVYLPSSTASIAEAFFGCTELKNLVIEEGLTQIVNRYTLSEVSSLNSITIPKSVTTIQVVVFVWLPKDAVIRCPKGSFAEKSFQMISGFTVPSTAKVEGYTYPTFHYETY